MGAGIVTVAFAGNEQVNIPFLPLSPSLPPQITILFICSFLEFVVSDICQNHIIHTFLWFVSQVSKNRNGRKRKHPISSSGPANSSGTTNTAGASPSSTPSTLSAHSPGETISTPLQHQNASSCTTLVVYGSEGPVPIGSPTNQLVSCSMLVHSLVRQPQIHSCGSLGSLLFH